MEFGMKFRNLSSSGSCGFRRTNDSTEDSFGKPEPSSNMVLTVVVNPDRPRSSPYPAIPERYYNPTTTFSKGSHITNIRRTFHKPEQCNQNLMLYLCKKKHKKHFSVNP